MISYCPTLHDAGWITSVTCNLAFIAFLPTISLSSYKICSSICDVRRGVTGHSLWQNSFQQSFSAFVRVRVPLTGGKLFFCQYLNYATCYWGSAVVGKPSDAYLFNSISSLLWCFFFRLCPVGCLDAAPAGSKSGPSLCFATGLSEAVQLYGAVSSDMLRKSVLGHLQRAEVNNMCI